MRLKRWLALFSLLFFASSFAQEASIGTPAKEKEVQAPAKVDIKPTARDFEIRDRLEAILRATGWFKDLNVTVEEGVVFFNGLAKTEDHKKWAGELALKTQDVSAVVNKLQLIEPSIWDFQVAVTGLKNQWRDLKRILPSLLFVLIIFVLTLLIAKLASVVSRKVFKTKIESPLLLSVVSRAIGFVVILLGLYIIFKMLGLTTVALTIIGGTGILGIILGIAFRDITENLLASVFLSIHHPFQNGDLVEITGVQGYVQRLTIRSTVLMSLDGNHVQIPNATVYKTNIRNFSVNPNRQEMFILAIGDDEDIPSAQALALKILEDHPAVLKDPEPWVLADSLLNAVVNLRVYFWLDGSQHSWLKVRSSVIRLIKSAFKEKGIRMPSDVKEIIFASELPVRIREKGEPELHKEKEKPSEEKDPVATNSEAGLRSEIDDIQEQARQSRPPQKDEKNLLDSNEGS